jgi:hypothetical protein
MKLLKILLILSFATATDTDVDGNRTLAFQVPKDLVRILKEAGTDKYYL